MKPLYSCGFEEPCRWLQCSFWGPQVNGKRVISTIFLGFYPIFAYFCLFLSIFSGICLPDQRRKRLWAART